MSINQITSAIFALLIGSIIIGASAQTVPVSTADSVIYRFNMAEFAERKIAFVNVDVFWCEGSNSINTSQNYVSALLIAGGVKVIAEGLNPGGLENLKKKLKKNLKKNDALLPEFDPALVGQKSPEVGIKDFGFGNIRVRFLPAKKNSSADYGITSTEVHFDANDPYAEIVAGIILISLPTATKLVEMRVDQPGYVQVFACNKSYTTQFSGRVFFQISSPKQEEFVRTTINGLKPKYTNLNIANGIEVVGEKAPAVNQVRYFFPQDKLVATALAAELNSGWNQTVNQVFLGGLADKTKPGTIEVWLAK